MGKEGQDSQPVRIGRAPFIASLVIALVGLGLAAELIHVHAQVHSAAGATPTCDYTAEINCSDVANSGWASVLGVPTAAWALLAYAGFVFLAILGLIRRVFPDGPGGLLFWGALPALGFGLFLMYVMAYEVEAWCVNCLGLDIVNVGLVVTGFLAARRRGLVPALLEDLGALADNKPAAFALVGGPALAGLLIFAQYSSEAHVPPPTDPDAGLELPDGGFPEPRGEPNLEGAPTRGPADAPIQIVEFSDYQCPFCSAAHDEVRAVMEAHPDQIRFTHFHHPLDMACNPAIRRPFHRHACLAAAAAICATEQNRFWQLNDLLFEHGRELDEELLARLVREAGELDQPRLERCMRSESTMEHILHDLEEALQVPVEGTPTFIINGRVVSGFRPGLYRAVLTELLRNDGRWPAADANRE